MGMECGAKEADLLLANTSRPMSANRTLSCIPFRRVPTNTMCFGSLSCYEAVVSKEKFAFAEISALLLESETVEFSRIERNAPKSPKNAPIP